MKFYKPKSGAVLPALTNPASASDIASSKQAIDGAGIKIVGTLTTVTNGGTTHDGTPEEWGNYIRSKYTLSNDILIRSGNDISIRSAKTEYGNATAEDVAAGKTFTSASGLKVAGTKEDKMFEIFSVPVTDGSVTATFSFTPKSVIGIYYGYTFSQRSTYPEIVSFIVKDVNAASILFYTSDSGDKKINKYEETLNNSPVKFTMTGNTFKCNYTSSWRLIPDNKYLIIGLSEKITV